MYEKKIITVALVVFLSGLVTMLFLFLLFSDISTTGTTATINHQEASAFFHEKLFGGSNTKPQTTTNVKPTNTPTTTSASSKQNGTLGDDNIRGTDQNDVLVGLAGNDTITGQAGDDNIDGSEGNDYLIGGPGADTLSGSLGQDNFVCGPGKDLVLDFNATEGDIRSNDCEAAATVAITTNK
jgi:Ca2+-binding RTX toxin-like protein